MNPKEYHIDSFEKLVNVANKENIERLSIDLVIWLATVIDIMDKTREVHPEETKGKSNWEISRVAFRWVDDGKNDILGVTVENPETGETVKHKFK